MEELDTSKSLILEPQRFFSLEGASFVLDTEEDIELLKNAIKKIKEYDNAAELYIVTYPQFSKRMVYADNILIRTSMGTDAIRDLFSSYKEIQPSLVDRMTEEERDSAEWIDLNKESYYDDYLNIYSIYWD